MNSTPVDQAKLINAAIGSMPSSSRQRSGRLKLLPTVVYCISAK